MKLAISFRQILEYETNILVIPYKDATFSIYPGNIINRCRGNLR